VGYWERVPDGGLEIFYEDTHDGRWRNGQLVVERYLITCVRLIGQEVREFFFPIHITSAHVPLRRPQPCRGQPLTVSLVDMILL